MKILHIYKVQPDETTRVLASAWADGNQVTEIHLYRDEIDYSQIIEQVFRADRVLSW